MKILNDKELIARNNPNSPIFVSFNKESKGRKRLTINGLYEIYYEYKKVFFPKLLSIIDPSLHPQKTTLILHSGLVSMKSVARKDWNMAHLGRC